METETQLLVCERCETPLDADDLRCFICGHAAPFQLSVVRKTAIQVLRCKGCGAAVAYDPKHRAPSCAFCGDVVEIETIQDPMEQTDGYLPFTLDATDAQASLQRWLASLGWFRPSDLLASARLEQLKPLWWVAWVFDADAWISWSADSNAGSHRSDWAPHSGQNRLVFDDILVSASRGLTDAEVNVITPGMNLASACSDPEGAEAATIEQFDLQRSQARQHVGWAIRNLAAERVKQAEIPGTRFRKVNVSVVVRKLVTRRLSFPAYVMAYRYRNELYRVVICGQDGRLVVGKAPWSVAKFILVIGLCVLFVLGLLVLVAAAGQ